MKILTLSFLSIALVSCPARHQEGGDATTEVPQAEFPTRMSIHQPENPEGTSSMDYEQTKTLVHPDGTVETVTTRTATAIGGSQDLSKIIKEYAGSEYFKGLASGLGMILAAWWMYRKEWEMVATILAIAGVFCIFWSWLAAPLGIGAAVLVAGGHYKTLALKVVT